MAGIVVQRRPQRQLSVWRRTTEGVIALHVVEGREAARTAQHCLKRALETSNEDSDDDEEFEAYVARAQQACLEAALMQCALRFPHPTVAPVLLDIDGLDPAQWYMSNCLVCLCIHWTESDHVVYGAAQPCALQI